MIRRKTLPSSFKAFVEADSKGVSLAAYLAGQLLISEEEASDLIDFGSVQLDGRQERNPSRLLDGGEEFHVHWPWHGIRRFYEVDPGRILYRDGYLLAYDKEPGIPSQQTPSDGYNNLFSALYRYLQRAATADPYVALHHRLDQDTSGIMLFALDRSANHALGNAFQHHRVVKEYVAWIAGVPSKEHWVATDDITRKEGRYQACARGHGKHAQTSFHLLFQEGGRSLVLARPRTGRTHQIRLHLAAAGHPVVGDRLYGGGRERRLYLHAYRLKLGHPITRSDLSLEAPIPPDWQVPSTVSIPHSS